MKLLLAALLAGAVLAPGAAGDAVYHSQHIALEPVGGAPLRSGFVENIHPNGPQVFAHEEYVLVGAVSETAYSVTLHISSAPDCSAPFFEPTTATFTTNAAGNGAADAVIRPDAVEGLHGQTIHAYWTVSGGDVAYETACQTVRLD
jgi:hypothetical protein